MLAHCELVIGNHGEELRIDAVAYGQRVTGKARGRLTVHVTGVPSLPATSRLPSTDEQLEVKSLDYKTCVRAFNAGYMRVPGMTQV
jgi:hypothetical protein